MLEVLFIFAAVSFADQIVRGNLDQLATPTIQRDVLHELFTATNGTLWSWKNGTVWDFDSGSDPCIDRYVAT